MRRIPPSIAFGLSACFALVGCTTSVEGNRAEPDAKPVGNAAFPDADPIEVPDAEPVVQPCVEGDKRVTNPDDGTCYMLINALKNWTDAQAGCIALGATLVSIGSQAEQTLVATLAVQYPALQPDLWLGATDVLVENTFTWVDQKPFGYTHWRAGEPNNNGPGDLPENCALIEGDNPAVEWDDRSCVTPLPSICKR